MAAIVLATLLVAVVSLTIANAVQRPRLAQATLDTSATVDRNARVALTVDQVVDRVEASAATITPAVPFEVTASGASIALRFAGPLDYSTDYRIDVEVRGSATGRAALLEHRFRTPDAVTYGLLRQGADASGEDAIVRHRISTAGHNAETVFTAPRIQEYAMAAPSLAVVTPTGESNASLLIADLDGVAPPRTLVHNANVTQVHASGPGGLIGYSLYDPADPVSVNGQLHILDPRRPDAVPVPLTGLDGYPLAPFDWSFVPGTTSLVAQTSDRALYLVDPVNGAPIRPLGRHQRMRGFVPGTATLMLEDTDTYSSIDLTTGASTDPLPYTKGRTPLDLAQLLPAGPAQYVGVEVRERDDDLIYAVVLADDAGWRDLYLPPAVTDEIERICVSPNGQYAAVEIVGEDATPDDYDNVPGFTPSLIVLVEVKTGRADYKANGSLSDWC